MLILGLTVIACAQAQRETSATQDTLPGTFDFTNQHSVIDEKERQFKQNLNTSISQSFKGLTSPLSGLLKQDSVQGKALLNSIKPTITLPRFSLKDPLRINGGYVGYNFDYRSNIDTPFIDKNVAQNVLAGQLGVTAFNAVPLKVQEKV